LYDGLEAHAALSENRVGFRTADHRAVRLPLTSSPWSKANRRALLNTLLRSLIPRCMNNSLNHISRPANRSAAPRVGNCAKPVRSVQNKPRGRSAHEDLESFGSNPLVRAPPRLGCAATEKTCNVLARLYYFRYIAISSAGIGPCGSRGL